MEKLTKQQIKRPDLFLQEAAKIWRYFEAHRATVFSTLLGLALVGGGVSIYSSLAEQKESKAQAAYFQVERKLYETKETFLNPDEDPSKKAEKTADADKKTPPKPEKKAPTGDLTKDYGTVVAELEKFVDEYRGSRAAVMGAMNLAQLYHDYKDAAKGITVLEKAAVGLSKKELFYVLVHAKTASLLMSAGQYQRAVEQWTSLLNNERTPYAHGYALLNLGICYEQLKEPTRAMEMYRKASSEHASEESGKTARKLLLQLELRQGDHAEG